jgi:hypothetical protein
MLMVIGMGLLYVGTVEGRTTPPLHNNLPSDPTAYPLSSPPPPSREIVREKYKNHLDHGEW